jgi:hypothetical protein
MPADDFKQIFAALKPVFSKHEKRLAVKADTPIEYTLVSKSPSPFPQHKGQPMYFDTIRLGKAYVSFHVYMSPELYKLVTPELKKRMQGKTCFNFKTEPAKEHLAGLKQLVEAGLNDWKEEKWL